MPNSRMNWIWLKNEKREGYAEFLSAFAFSGGKAELKISADRRYAAFVNGQFAANGQYADYPEHKSVDRVDITPLLRVGENELRVIAFHAGEDYAAAHTMEAGAAFEITADGKVIAASGADTLCRPACGYSVGDAVSPQIGKGFCYDFTRPPEAWENCRLVACGFREEPRPNLRCGVDEPVEAVAVAQGIFSYRGGKTAGERAQNAWMAPLRFSEMTGENRLIRSDFRAPVCFSAEGGDGIYILTDLGQERTGYLSLSVTVPAACCAIVTWGEHLADLRVRAAVGSRNFAAALTLNAGENRLDDYLHRVGCRYLCLYAESGTAKVERLTIRPSEYPFRKIGRRCEDRLLQKIYEVGEHTLRQCAHEHYEDCPWREQALYGMDSRNQMLFGYGVFEEYDLPRASLRLLAYSVREDGLLDLCAPARAAITIPSFSVYWMIALCENAEADYDEAFVREMLPYAERMLSVFEARTEKTGIAAFVEPRYWNFHEWSEGLDGGVFFRSEPIEPYADGVLTALVLSAAEGISRLEDKIGNRRAAEAYSAYADRLADSLSCYYAKETGLYASFLKGGAPAGYHAYAQAVYLLTGRIPAENRARMCAELKNPTIAVKPTLAALQAKYEAILRTDGDVRYCVDDICAIFGKMIFSGATSYWETENGEADFEDAGSLCHGWSSVACYVFDRCGIAKREQI